MYNDSVIEALIKFNSQTVGRDRFIRLLQYSSKVIWWLLEKIDTDKELVIKFKDLEYSLSTGRKLLRLGRFIDILYGALKTVHLHDAVIRTTVTLMRITQALYLLTDHILWIGRMGLFQVNKTKWSEKSNKFWLLSIIFALMRDVYELHQAIIAEMTMQRRKSISQGVQERRIVNRYKKQYIEPTVRCLQGHKDIVVDTVKNGCDLFIPLSSLGYVNLTPGSVGLLGVISSLSGILSLINPALKLQPN